MTTGTRVVGNTKRRHKVLLVSDGIVVRTHNHPDTGPLIPILASLLIDEKVQRCYIAGIRLYEPLARFNEMVQGSVPGWRMRITNRQRHAFTSQGEMRVTGRFFVDYLAIDKHSHNKRDKRRRFDIMNLDLIREHPPNDLDEQMEMTLSILEMCDSRGIAFRGTRGALGSAMLKKSRYWVRGRIAAPRFINQQARKYLPGNFYSVSNKVREKRGLEAIDHCYYVDQRSAHHNIVGSILLPHPQHLHARGYYKTFNGRWCDQYSPTGQDLLSGRHLGLVLCRIAIGTLGPTIEHLYPNWARKRGTHYKWLWTPELRLLKDEHKLQLDYFVAGYTATQDDPVLREYSEWALSEIARNPERAPYKKGSLLAAYGMLAFNGEKRAIYRYWGGKNSRKRVSIPYAGKVSESKISIPDSTQLSVVNVISRGLIEAETRTRSIEYAKSLHAQGFHVPQIYADGVLVETHQLPFVPDGWRVAHSLTNVYIPRPNAIVSDQICKLPGVGGDQSDREWERRREDARRIFVTTYADEITEVVA